MKNLLKHARILTLLFATAFVSACSQDASNPTAPRTNSAAFDASSALAATSSGQRMASSTSLTTPTVAVLTFRSGVKTKVTASQVIGSEGGYLVLSETGFSLYVPRGAVSSPTTFKVTPVGDGLVAYDFEPHGVTFDVPLVFMQDLSKTNYVAGKSISGAYFTSPTKVNATTQSAEISELFTMSFDGFGLSFFSIKHFSGYLVSMG